MDHKTTSSAISTMRDPHPAGPLIANDFGISPSPVVTSTVLVLLYVAVGSECLDV